MSDFIYITADKAVKLRGKEAKVLICTDEKAINEFRITRFSECEDLISEGKEIWYLIDDFMEMLHVVTPQKTKKTATTILLSPNT